MSSIDKIMKILDEFYYFLKKNQEIIDWNKIEKDLIKLESQIKRSIVPSNKIKDIFSNKKLFPTQAHIKKFMKDSFNRDIKGKSYIDIFSELTYYSIEIPDLISKIENKLKSVKTEVIVTPSKKPKGRQEMIIDET
jgi:hypothetical protein